MFRSDTNSNKRLLFGRVNLHTLMHARKTSHKHPQKNTHTRTHTSPDECAVISIFFCACVRCLSKWFPPDFLTLSVLIFANFTWVILQWWFFFLLCALLSLLLLLKVLWMMNFGLLRTYTNLLHLLKQYFLNMIHSWSDFSFNAPLSPSYACWKRNTEIMETRYHQHTLENPS